MTRAPTHTGKRFTQRLMDQLAIKHRRKAA